MYLKKRKVNGIYYWSIVETFRQDGKIKQRIVENLGNTEKAYVILQEKKEYSPFLKTVAQYAEVRSPLLWFGGKSKLAKTIIELMPQHKTYVEPFGGAGHVLVQKKRAPVEVYNDLNKEVVNFLMVVREQPERFYQAVETLPYSRELYESWRKSSLPDDTFERAVRWFYINRGGIVGAHKGQPGGWRHGKSHNTVGSYRSAVELINPLAERLRRVNIESKDFREIIEKYDSPDTFFYIDPPYVGRESRYDGGFSEKDHRDLAELLSHIKGKAFVSYYADPIIDELYADWHVKKFETYAFSKLVKQDQQKDKTVELFITNYPCEVSA
ncbi:DNA adenine methylase [Paenibacillus larvae]|uniref:DNA adenine methylase n=1 Tax=Paenibacillus larvae TaxID=1464 RepID=UPI0022815C44|nr:DNA adenine methylase [Paenibacillus larvae]MCY9747844.1 DNA adenine methylase [Paenibacillus larvae]MCY9751911.1 DNA adenine methylase [Paenibacillus larvae]